VSRPLIYVDTSDVRDGALGELKDQIVELASHVERTPSQVIAYNAFFSADGDRMSVAHVHPEPSSLDQFMTLAGPRFERFTELLTLRSINVYGEPTPALCGSSRTRRCCSAATSRCTRRTPDSADSGNADAPPPAQRPARPTDQGEELPRQGIR
jgi:hypothetical protein